jgi:phosphate transport system permease protein
VMGTLGLILWTVIARGLPALTWEMVSQTPKGGFYMGKGGGVLNAILGSIYIGLGSTLLALVLSLPIALALNTYVTQTRWQERIRLMLDVLWGIPSIVYGAFGFTVMLTFGLRASLLAGIVIVALVILPIMIRAMDEVLRRMPEDLTYAALALGTTRFEVARDVVMRQMLPGLVTAVLLGFGRGIGDAASVLFTAGYTDRMPTSLFAPTATLPLAVLFQLSTPFEAVRERGYASALILTIMVFVVSIGARWLAHRLSRYTIK